MDRTDIESLEADGIIRLFDLAPHPEGGFFRETFRDPQGAGGRSVGTAIYFLLPAGAVSAWHRVDAAEIWHFYAGAPLRLSIHADGGPTAHHRLGRRIAEGQQPQIVVPARAWQSAVSEGAWTLVGCTVAPGFEFSGFEMAPPGWEPG